MRTRDRTTTGTFHRSVCSRNSGLLGPLSDLAAHSLSSEPADSLRLCINDSPPGLAFLYHPILLESPEATYVVEWSEAKAGQKSRAYITTAKEKHAELHTFMYVPRKVCHPLLVHLSVRRLVVTMSVWYYLCERRWSLADIKTLWDSLGPVLAHSFPYPRQRLTLLRVS
jgi:hypothetical protein